jgi:hypothetical protein
MVAIFGIFLIHGLLLAVSPDCIANRSEVIWHVSITNHLKHEIQRLTQALELEKQNTVLVAQANNKPNQKSKL